MMKISWAVSLSSAILLPWSSTVVAANAPTSDVVTLPCIGYDDLTSYRPGKDEPKSREDALAQATLLEALQTMGMISISHVPGFVSQRTEPLAHLEDCMNTAEPQPIAETFPDGTLRQTLGLQWSFGNEIPSLADRGGDECQALSNQAHLMQNHATWVLNQIALVLQDALGLGETPLLLKEQQQEEAPQDNGSSAFSLSDIVAKGDVIEHYHAYYYGNHQDSPKKQTMDWHIDQGFMLLFTPGRRLGDTEPTEGFHVRLPDGSEPMVHFQQEDHFIVMLGDGVNQYLNPKLATLNKQLLRAAPHALSLPSNQDEDDNQKPRLWYGRMVLPPPQAVHPVQSEWTYGHLREAMNQERGFAQDKGPALALGCSSDTMRALHTNNGHNNSTLNCSHHEFPCWHQCQNISDLETEAICQAQGMELQCIINWTDPHNHSHWERLLWDGGHRNPAFKPGCILHGATVYDEAIHGSGHTHTSAAGVLQVTGATVVSFLAAVMGVAAFV